MSVVPRERAGMASGISTTSRCGHADGFCRPPAVILATVTRSLLTNTSCTGVQPCGYSQAFADAVVAGDLRQAVTGGNINGKRPCDHANKTSYSSAFAAAILGAAVIAVVSAWCYTFSCERRISRRKRIR